MGLRKADGRFVPQTHHPYKKEAPKGLFQTPANRLAHIMPPMLAARTGSSTATSPKLTVAFKVAKISAGPKAHLRWKKCQSTAEPGYSVAFSIEMLVSGATVHHSPSKLSQVTLPVSAAITICSELGLTISFGNKLMNRRSAWVERHIWYLQLIMAVPPRSSRTPTPEDF